MKKGIILLVISMFFITNVYAKENGLSDSYSGVYKVHTKSPISLSWANGLISNATADELGINMQFNLLNDSDSEFILTLNVGGKKTVVEHTKGTYTLADNKITYTKKNFVNDTEEKECTAELINSETANLCNSFTGKNSTVELSVDNNKLSYSGNVLNSLPLKKIVLLEKNSDTVWSTFVDQMISKSLEEMISLVDYEYEVNDENVKVTIYFDSWMQILLGLDISEYTVEFTYKDGILTYIPKEKVDFTIIIDNTIITKVLEILAEKNNTELDALENYLDNKTNLSLATDGIAIKKAIYNMPANSLLGMETMSISEDEVMPTSEDGSTEYPYYTLFQLDVANGIKTSDNKVEYLSNDTEEVKEDTVSTTEVKEETVENPKTGVYTTISIVAFLSMVIGSLTYLRVRNKSKFPQI